MPFEECSLDEVRQRSGSHVFGSTVKYFDGELSLAEYREFRSSLATNSFGIGSDRTCLIFGYGSQPRHVYEVLSRHNDIKVLWTGTCCSLLLLPFSLTAVTQSGLLLIKSPDAARIAFHLLSYMGPAEVLSFSSNIIDEVTRHVKRIRLWGFRAWPEEIVGNDPSYFLFGVERNHPQSEMGITGWCSYGPDCPPVNTPLLIPGHDSER